MKTKIPLSVIVSTVLLLVPCSFAKQAKQDPLTLFQNELEQDGFDVTPGVVASEGQPADSPACEEEPVSDSFTEELIGDLTANGFQVSRGCPKLYIMDDCYERTYPTLKSCFLGNPAAPYVLPVVKLWPDEYVDPAAMNAFVETKPGYSVTYRLDPREAIVIYGQMPPPGRYMGVQTWVFSQHGNWKTKDYDQWANTPDLPIPIQYLFDTIPPDDPKSHRVISLSALGDVVNNVVMQRKLHEFGEEDDDPFGKTMYFIITPSASTDNAIRLALQAQGVPDSHIFTEQIPRTDDLGPIGPLGMGKNAIDFWTAFRYAVPDNADDAQEWRESPPLTVLRVRAPDSLGPVKRYGSLTFEPRTANSEDDYADDMQQLVDAVCDRVSSNSDLTSTDCVQPPPATSFMTDVVLDYGWIGPYCRKIGMDCLGDQQEAIYYITSPLPTGDDLVYAVVSTLATETGNATYVGLSANDASIMGGVPDGTVIDTDLKGSADAYAPGDNSEQFSEFFVHYFSTDCAAIENVSNDCGELDPESGGSKCCTEISGLSTQGDPALQGMITISLRDYIAPGTQRGPDSNKVLRPRVLTFTQP